MNQRNKIQIGQYGEKLAQEFLKDKNYQIVKTNYRSKFGEIDIIARRNDIFIFCEVKTKTNIDFGRPEEMVTKPKKEKLKRLVKIYLQDEDISAENQDFQIDIISVMIKKGQPVEIKHIENITSYE